MAIAKAGDQLANASALRRIGWSKEITMAAILRDPMLNIPSLTGMIDPGNSRTMVPGKVIQDVTPQGDGKYARSIVLEYMEALDGDGYYGNNVDSIEGHEEAIIVKYFKAFANDWVNAVQLSQFGINYREQEPSKIFAHAKPLLAQWWGEREGAFMREALCESVSSNLTIAPTSLDSEMNSNVYIVDNANTVTEKLTQQSGYATYQLYLDAVATKARALVDAGLPATHSQLLVRPIMDIADAAAESYIKPLKWKDKELYILYTSSDQFTNLTDPSLDGSFGKNWVAAANITDLNKVVPGAEFIIADSVVVCRDRRSPVALFQSVSPGAGSDTAEFKYVKMGRNDERKGITVSVDSIAFDVHVLLGEAAIAKFHPEPPHYEDQDEIYTKYNNVAFFGACGYSTPKFVLDAAGTPNLETTVNEGSMLVLTYKGAYSASLE